MTDLTRTQLTSHEGEIVRWVVTGAEGAIELTTVDAAFVGWYVHSRTDRYYEGRPSHCPILGGDCWSEALSQTDGRDVFASRLTSEAAIYERLEQEYRRVWPAAVDPADCDSAWHSQRDEPTDVCPQCGIDAQGHVAPNAGSAS